MVARIVVFIQAGTGLCIGVFTLENLGYDWARVEGLLITADAVVQIGSNLGEEGTAVIQTTIASRLVESVSLTYH